MNDTLKVLETRRSCRNFKPDMIPEETLEQIVRAGTYAPTGMGKQSPIILAVTNKELRDQFSEENRKIMGAPVGMDPFYGAPVIRIRRDRPLRTRICSRAGKRGDRKKRELCILCEIIFTRLRLTRLRPNKN